MEWIVEAETLSDFIDHGRYTITSKPLIRCKDCEFYHPYYCEAWSRFGTMQTEPDGYCYKAVREEGEADAVDY